MVFEVDLNLYKWLVALKIIRNENTLQPNNKCVISEDQAKLFENGYKVGEIILEIFKKRNLPSLINLNHLKKSNHTAAQLYNWNVLNESMRKLNYQIDSDMKNLIINGDYEIIGQVLTNLQNIYNSNNEMEDSLQMISNKNQLKRIQQSVEADQAVLKQQSKVLEENVKLSNSVSTVTKQKQKQTQNSIVKESNNVNSNLNPNSSDLLEYVLETLSVKLKLTKKQAIALIADNNKYLAHVLVKGVKGSFVQVEEIMQTFYQDNDTIVQKITKNNDLCPFYLQIIKPALLSKNEEIAMWACRILSKIAYDLANQQLLPIAYEWFIKQNGGLATTILCLSRHPKLNDSVVTYILQFARYNVSQLFTVQLRKFTNDNINYLKFILLIFNPLVESKISSEDILNSGALDYWIELAEKGADSDYRNSIQMRIISLELLIKIWKSYPIHIQETLNLVNNMMNYIKKGIREDSSILRFHFTEQLFSLLIHFANQKNPYASILYKKITFMFIENHEIGEFRELVLRNVIEVFRKFQSIPVQIFLEPFVKQIKISEGKSYVINIFDMEFIKDASEHKKLKVKIAIELLDFLAKTFLNNVVFSKMALASMERLFDRFIEDEAFVEYTIKLVKICLAIFFASLKGKKPKQIDDNTRLNMQKRAQIVNFILYIVNKQSIILNEEIKILVVHIKIQIQHNFKIQHQGINEILRFFGDPDDVKEEVMNNHPKQEEEEINQNEMISIRNRKQPLHLPRINSKHSARDQLQVLSQKTNGSKATHQSKNTKQEFPIKDYEQFETQDEKRFMKEHGIGIKKKKSPEPVYEVTAINQGQKISREKKQAPNIKVLEQIDKIREKKEEEIRKKQKQQQKIEKKKEQLKDKIKKQLQQRNLAMGNFGAQRNIEPKFIFEDGEIDQKIFQETEIIKQINLKEEEQRQDLSIQIVFKKYQSFLKKIFTKYSYASNLKKKQFIFDDDTLTLMSQLDLLRMFKEKNIQKNKVILQEIYKIVFKKEKATQGIDYDAFLKFLEQYCIHAFYKEKYYSIYPLGHFMKQIIKKLAYNQNIKMEEQEDQLVKQVTQRLKENPLFEIPNNIKKITQKTFIVKNQLSANNLKQLPQKFIICYQIINDLLFNKLKIKIMEDEVEIKEENKLVKKITPYLPPKIKKQNIPLLQDKQKPSEDVNDLKIKRDKSQSKPLIKAKINNISEQISKTRIQSKSVQKKINPIQKKRIQQQQEKKKQQLAQQQQRKQRALEVKRKLQQQQQQRKQEKQQKKQQQRILKEKQEQRIKKEKESKQNYLKEQKQKLDKYKKDQEREQNQKKKKKQEQQKKTEELKKEAVKLNKKKQDEKRKQDAQNLKKKKQKEEEQQKLKKIEEQKKKQNIKKQAQKFIENDKQKREQEKNQKQKLKKLYTEPQIIKVFTEFKEQIKALYIFGMEFNDYKIELGKKQNMEQKGWLFINQSFNLCDLNTAQLIFKGILRDKSEKGISFESLEQILLGLSTKSILQKKIEDNTLFKKQACESLKSYIEKFGIPKQKNKQKQFFIALKTSKKAIVQRELSKQKRESDNEFNNLQKMEEVEVTNPQGRKQKWNMKN